MLYVTYTWQSSPAPLVLLYQYKLLKVMDDAMRTNMYMLHIYS